MNITTEQYNTLKLLADDIATARAAPKELERFIKIVVDDDGKDRVVRKFSADMTRAAILIAMAQAVEQGKSPLSIVKMTAAPKVVPVEEISQEPVDEFTAAALAQIPAGKPDSSTLNPPHVKLNIGDKVIGLDGKKMVVHDEFPRTEGHYWIDDKGRHWKIIGGRKVQQKKPKVQNG